MVSYEAAYPSISFSQAKDQLSRLTLQANATGRPFVIEKNRKPWVEVRPLAVQPEQDNAIKIMPVKREVPVADLDALFEGHSSSFCPREDGFASAVGAEEL